MCHLFCAMVVKDMIDELRTAVCAQCDRTLAVQQLPSERLLYRPAPDAWNVLEVFEHLNLSSGIYVRGLEEVFANKAKHLKANPMFSPGLMGNWFTNGLRPSANGRIRWKMRTIKMFDPALQRGATLQDIEDFVALCNRLLVLLDQARMTDLNRLKVTSSLGPLIRFKAGDALRFPIAHQARHFIQIETILAHTERA